MYMIKIRSSLEMITYQQLIFTKLNNDTILKNLKLLFFNNPVLACFIDVFIYIYIFIKKNMSKVKACGGIIYTISFNYTSSLGIVLYNNTIIVKKCKKINDYSTNTGEIIIQSYNNFVNGIKFLNTVNNQLVQQALSSGIPNQWFSTIDNGITSYSAYTPGASLGTTTDSTILSYTLSNTTSTGTEESYNGYTGRSFTNGCNTILKFSNIPINYKFGICMCGGGGGSGGTGLSGMYTQQGIDIYTTLTNGIFTGGGGAGILTSTDTTKDIGFTFEINIEYTLNVGKPGVFNKNHGGNTSINDIICYGGKNGSETSGGLGGSTTNIDKTGCFYDGGNGGFEINSNGIASGLGDKSIIIPFKKYCSNVLGGGGATCDSSGIASGGHGIGGTLIQTGSPGRNTDAFGGFGGGSAAYEITDSEDLEYSYNHGGEGNLYLWWYKAS